MNLDRHPTIFARLSDKPGMFACLTHSFPAPDVTREELDAFFSTDAGPEYSVVASDSAERANLPLLENDAAEEVAAHAYYSGGNVLVAARVRAERGVDALYDYADTQNVYSMPGAPDMPEEQLKWVGSGLTPTPTTQGA